MLCDTSDQLYWGRDVWHLHTLLSLDEPSKIRIIKKRQRFIEGYMAGVENEVSEIYPSDDVCESTEAPFGIHINSLVIFAYLVLEPRLGGVNFL